MGHMKEVQQGTQSTTKNNNNEQQNDDKKDEEKDDDIDNFELEPPHPHLELAKGHQVTCGVVEYKELKGLICTDLPGRFPFESSARNNYIFVLYDFDTNNIIAKPIKSRSAAELVRGYNLCYDELKEANITPILHRLDNKIFDDLIRAIKRKKLKRQVVTSYDHRQNSAERAIQTFKCYFISAMNGADKDFPASAWCKLLLQVTMNINMN